MGCRQMFRLEFERLQVVEAHVRPHGVVVSAPRFNDALVVPLQYCPCVRKRVLGQFLSQIEGLSRQMAVDFGATEGLQSECASPIPTLINSR